VTELQDQLDVLPRSTSATGAETESQQRAKRRSGSLTGMLLPELQALAGSLGLPATKQRKSDLISAIQLAQNGAGKAVEATASTATRAASTRTRRTASRAAGPTESTTAAEPVESERAAPARQPRAARGNAQTELPVAVESVNNGSADIRNFAESVDGGSIDGGSIAGEEPSTSRRNRDRNQGERTQGERNPGGRNGGGRDNQNRGPNNEPRNSAQGNNEGRNNAPANNNARNNDEPRNNSARNNEARNNVQNDDDDEFGNSRRSRRYRDRRGRTRDRFDTGSGSSRQDVEPTVSDDDVLIPVAGILDNVDDKNAWFIRVSGYFASPDDIYVANSHVRRYGLRRGDAVTGAVRQARDGERKEKFNPLVRLDSVNGVDPEQAKNRVEFTKLTPLYPQERLRLETEPQILTTRIIDLVMPIGKGQRALVVSPPKAGKTSVLQAIANAIAVNNPECHLMVVLVDERPEEVTDMQRSVKGEVIASTFDRKPSDHTMIAELSIERAKRLVEMGHDVVVLLDSITRLGRAYNLAAPASGRILSGGVDSTALYPPKRFLGAARNIEDGGSLTIIATALVETGSTMDTVIFEEFKGTGNAELILDRRIADKRTFPAVDVDRSGTRKEEILMSPEELAVVLRLRRVLHALEPQQGIDLLLDRLKKSRTNIEFLMTIAKTAPGDDDR